MSDAKPYILGGNKFSDQAENSSANPRAADIQMRILIELQVISMILREVYDVTDDLQQMRADIAQSIT